MKKPSQDLIELHIASFVLSWISIFAKLVALPAMIIILGRSVFTTFGLFGFQKSQKQSLKIKSKRDRNWLILTGILMAAHWSTYFYSVQLSTIAVAAVALFTYPIITIFLEPLFIKDSHLHTQDIVSGILILVGVYFVIPEFSLANNITLGVFWGVLSALIFSIRNITSKKYLSHYNGAFILMYQSIITTIVLFPSWFYYTPIVTLKDILLIALLGGVITSIGHGLMIHSITKMKAKKVSIILSFQIIYHLIIGFVVLHEIPSLQVLIGAFIILVVVIFESMQKDD